MAKGGEAGHNAAAQLAEIRVRVGAIEARLGAIPAEIDTAKRLTLQEADVRCALEAFGPIWDALFPAERARIIRTLIQEVAYDGQDEAIRIAFRPNGFSGAAVAPTE